MASTYAKPHLSVADQLALLKGRGLVINDEPAAGEWLQRLGYYRLSAYWYPFRTRKFEQPDPRGPIVSRVLDTFEPGASFEAALELYAFDRKLRLLVLDAIEQIEVAARVDVAHYLGQSDPFAHANPALLDGNFTAVPHGAIKSKHAEWLDKLDLCTDRSKEEFVAHYKGKYGKPLPVWVSIEVWDFGLVSFFVSGMKPLDRQAMAKRFGVPNARVFASWLRSLNYLRNLAAHHSRMWNRNIVDQPSLPRAGEVAMFDGVQAQALDVARVYALLCVLAYLLRTIRPATAWHGEMAAHLASFPSVGVAKIDASSMGCPNDWKAHPFWN